MLDLIPTPSAGGLNTTHKIRTTGRAGTFKLPKGTNSPMNLNFQMICDCPIIKAALTRPKGPGRWLIMGKLLDDMSTVMVNLVDSLARQ